MKLLESMEMKCWKPTIGERMDLRDQKNGVAVDIVEKIMKGVS